MAGIAAAGIPAEKKSLHASERDTEENRQRRQEYLETVRAIAPERLIFLDESGVMVGMTPRYARCRGGDRIQEATPGGHWKILTILGAMSLGGMVAIMTIEEATDSDIFLAYLDQVLCPKLRPGDVVVMDNLSTHKVDGVRQRIQQCGGRTALPAALFAGLESDRKSMGQAQATAPCRQSLHRPGPRPSHHQSAAPDHRRQRRRMVQTPPRPYTEIGEMTSTPR